MQINENFRRNPKEYAPFMNSATRILAFGPYTVQGPEQKKELTELLHKLWNIDGVKVDKKMEDELINWGADIDSELLQTSYQESIKNGSGYMGQILNFLTNLKNK